MQTPHDFITLVCSHCGHLIQIPQYCGNRFCPDCSGHRRSALRTRINAIVKSIHLRPHDSVKMLTLTVPRDRDLAVALNRLLAAFRRFRQRAYWGKNVRGGCYFVEFKRTADGWNPHLHCVIESAYMPVGKIAAHWASVSPGQIVDIRRIPVGAVINYVSKYVTKSDLPLDDQVLASEALKGRRLFTLFGVWGKVKLPENSAVVHCLSCAIGRWYFVTRKGLGAWVDAHTLSQLEFEVLTNPEKRSEGEKQVVSSSQFSLDLAGVSPP